MALIFLSKSYIPILMSGYIFKIYGPWGAVRGMSLTAPFGWVYFQNIWGAVRGMPLTALFGWVYFQNIWCAVRDMSLTGGGVV